MRSNRTPVITIAGVDGDPDSFVATFRSEFLGATYAVLFPQTVTGAVALHRFATMISSQYGRQIEIQIPNDLYPVRNKAIKDILSSIAEPESVV
jgi:hypothetical protein